MKMISTVQELEALMADAAKASAVALDTEFVWERTFYPKLGLIQLAIEHDCYLIDPLAVKDLSALGKLTANPAVTKILHDAQQDLTILKNATGALPLNVFDTRMAFGFCSDTSCLSLAGLIQELCDIELPKSETRADWLRRPMSDSMLEYACDDVKYLTDAMNNIISRCEKQHTKFWMLEEMKIYDDPELYAEIPPEEYFMRIKGHGRLKRPQLAVLRELAAWREKAARKLDRPRNHVVPNNALIDLSYKCCGTMDKLSSVRDLSKNAIGRYGDNLLKCVRAGRAVPEDQLPQSTPRSRKNGYTDLVSDAIRDKAAEVNIDPTLICSKGDLNNLLNNKKQIRAREHKLFKGWRDEFMQKVCSDNEKVAEKMTAAKE